MMATKSPNRRVPSFRIYLIIKTESMAEFSWNPTSLSASRNRSAIKIPLFSLEWFLKTPCQSFKLHMRSLKLEKVIRPRPELSNATMT